MGEHGPVTAGEHGSHPAAAPGKRGVADRIDAAVNVVQPTRANALPNATRTEPKRRELRQRDDPMLAPR